MVMKKIESQELRIKLSEGTVQFAFKKIDGTLRTAIGTTNMTTVPQEHHPSGRGGESSLASVRYFDIEKGAWRSVSSSKDIFLAS